MMWLAIAAAGIVLMIRASWQLLMMGIWGVIGVSLLWWLFTVDTNTVGILFVVVILILLITRRS